MSDGSSDNCYTCNYVKSESDLKRYGWGDVELRDYQLAGVNWLAQRFHKGHGCILGDEMGLGKTCQTIAFLTYITRKTSKKKPHIVISPLSVLNNWIKEFERFSPGMKVQTYVGEKEKRGDLAQEIKTKTRQGGVPFDVLLTTYELCLKDSSFLGAFSWQILVVDEGHRLKNSESLLSQTLTQWDVEQHVLLTGTPVQNNLKELYSLLSFVSYKKFKLSNQQAFLDKFGDNTDNKVIEELHEILQPFILRRTKNEVLTDLPNKSEVVLYHGLTSLQKKLYKAILTKDISAFEMLSAGTNMGGPSTTRLMNILMQLRKCVNHPYLFDGVEPEPFLLGDHLIDASGKLLLIDKLLDHLQKTNHKVLLFSQMTHMLDILQDYLGYKGFLYERLDGSVRGEERYLAVQNFNENEDTFVFLLSTRAGGQGLNLTGADTVIFVDSDFNPQNDLQAAARAHRIGQTRAVKVIRLIGKNTVEEIILNRAEEKLKLTDKVIESGQFSVGTSKHGLFTSDKLKLQDILKYGVESLLSDEDITDEDINFQDMLGPTVSGEWQLKEAEESIKSESMSLDDEPGEVPQSMYVFEGTDYSKEPTAADVKAFTSLIEAEKVLLVQKEEEGRALRRKMSSLVGPLPDLPGKPRKKLTPEELEERRKKRQAAAELRAKAAEEEELREAQRLKQKKLDLWKKWSYTSCNITLNGEGEEEDEPSDVLDDDDDESERKAINYVSGDVTMPINTGTNDAIVVHCADDSGKWGKGGIFTALNNRSDLPEKQYELARQMQDIALGDCHLIPIDNKVSREEGGSDWLALIIAQHRDKRNKLSGIKLSALQHGLEKVCHVAKEKKASVHLPRIGHDTPGFNWYGTERLIKKHLASKGISTYIYYFPRRHMAKKRSLYVTRTDSEREFKVRKENSTSLKKDSSISLKKESSAAKASTSHESDDNSQAEVTLPDVFTGLSIHLYDCSADTMKRLKRFIIAYDGDLCQIVDEKTTHIVVSPDIGFEDLDSVVEKFKSVPVVSYEWLDESIKKGKLVSTTNYLFS